MLVATISPAAPAPMDLPPERRPLAARPVSEEVPYRDFPNCSGTPSVETGSTSPVRTLGSGETPALEAFRTTASMRSQSGHWSFPKAPIDNEGGSDSEEDWAVYDDYNNLRPLAKGPVEAGLTDGYCDDPETRGMHLSSTESFDDDELVPLAAGSRPQGALLADAFGFDAQNSDPRTWNEQQRAAASLARERNAIDQPNPELHLELADHGIELITVPALGAEYSDEERKRMTAPYKRRQKRKAKKRSISDWARGDSKVLGLDCRGAAFLVFFLCIVLGLVLYFVIPRVPSFDFLTTRPLDAEPDSNSMVIGHNPLNFSMSMNANMRVDNKGSYVPITVRNLDVKVRDQETNALVGEGKMESLSVAAHKKKEFQFPIDFLCRSINLTGDQTFLSFYHGCGPKWPGSSRPGKSRCLTTVGSTPDSADQCSSSNSASNTRSLASSARKDLEPR